MIAIDFNKYFVLSASCKAVDGASRSVIVDYSRGDVFFISNDYYELVKHLDRKLISDIEKDIDDDSKDYFYEFLQFLHNNEIGHFVDNPERFPIIKPLPYEMPTQIQDCIIEIHENYTNVDLLKTALKELKSLGCDEIQLRLLSHFDYAFLSTVLDAFYLDVSYIELHCSYPGDNVVNDIPKLVENYQISQIFFYSAPYSRLVEYYNNIPGFEPLVLGNVYFLNYPFDEGKCCGIINEHNLAFHSSILHEKLKTKNGCLDKKVSIDKYGNIKNCPSMFNHYGNITTDSISEIINSLDFQLFGSIHKDQIEVCKVCEFRYNCTDCRAFLTKSDDIFSKPKKCSYDPYSCTWAAENNVNSNN